jgi:arsenate reductase
VKNVLFVCLGNSCRSQMAEGFARLYGADVINAASAGLAATTSIAAETQEAMREKGVSLSDQFPKDFEPAIAATYDVVVNISGFLLPPVEGPVVLEWKVEDPYGDPLPVHRKVRDNIEERVLNLIAEIRRNGSVKTDAARGQRIAAEIVRRPGLWQRFMKWR